MCLSLIKLSLALGVIFFTKLHHFLLDSTMTETLRLNLNAQTTEDKAAAHVEERDSSSVKQQVVSAPTAPNGPKRSWGSLSNTGLNEKKSQNWTTKAKVLLYNTAEQRSENLF